MEEERKIKVNPVTGCQKEIMVEYIGSKKEMYTGKLTANYTKEKMIANWQELSNILNSVPGGPSKEWKQWRKTWVDLKKNQKAKFAGQKKYANGTGGGPPTTLYSLTNGLEAKLLEIITPVAISGNIEMTESSTFIEIPAVAGTSLDVTSIPGCENESTHNNDNVTPPEDVTVTQPPKRATSQRMNKTSRLQHSLKNNERFIDLTEKNNEIEKNYKKEKLRILNKDVLNKENFYKSQTAAFNKIGNAATTIATALTQISENMTIIKDRLTM